jgi:hypothetical protein
MEVSKNFKSFKTKKEQLLHNVDLLLEKVTNDNEKYEKAEQVKIVCGRLPIDITKAIEKKVTEKAKEYNKLVFEKDYDIKAEVMLMFVLP